MSVGHRDRPERIRETILDLKLAIDGFADQPEIQQLDAIASLARHCCIFLRKLALGDGRNQRLLDEDTCQMAGLGFDRLRRVTGTRRTLTIVPVDMLGGSIEATTLAEETREPEAVHVIPIGSQRLSFDVEWPLSGMADWLTQPTPENPWTIGPEALFESKPNPTVSCDEWLGQQLAIFDHIGITLNDVIRVMLNTEAAHSPPLGRLMRPVGQADRARFRVDKDKEILILSHMTICGVKYSHAIVIEAALYLYRKLTRNQSIDRPVGAGKILVFHFAPKDVFSPGQNWLLFDGGLSMSLGGAEQVISYTVKAPG